jgi:DMSO reductase anchor subunit
MHAPLSMIFFTTLLGAAQGLLLVLFALDAATSARFMQVPKTLFVGGAAVVLVLGVAGLVAASFHLGHPWRGWRAAARWRTSWLSREVIVLPAFLAAVLAWGAAHKLGTPTLVWGSAAMVLSLALFVCTGMIYAAVKALREWATPLTPVNYTLLGIANGTVLATALAAFTAPHLVHFLAVHAVIATCIAAALRGATLWRNLNLAPKTTLQTAIGVRHPRIVQKSQGAMGGSFNTREFFHGRSPQFLRGIRWAAALLGFALPVLLLALWSRSLAPAALGLLFVVQYLGMVAERWSFFAEANHPQNLYYRTIG